MTKEVSSPFADVSAISDASVEVAAGDVGKDIIVGLAGIFGAGVVILVGASGDGDEDCKEAEILLRISFAGISSFEMGSTYTWHELANCSR